MNTQSTTDWQWHAGYNRLTTMRRPQHIDYKMSIATSLKLAQSQVAVLWASPRIKALTWHTSKPLFSDDHVGYTGKETVKSQHAKREIQWNLTINTATGMSKLLLQWKLKQASTVGFVDRNGITNNTQQVFTQAWRETTPNATLSQPAGPLHQNGQRWEPF